jgi:hypothetical protein
MWSSAQARPEFLDLISVDRNVHPFTADSGGSYSEASRVAGVGRPCFVLETAKNSAWLHVVISSGTLRAKAKGWRKSFARGLTIRRPTRLTVYYVMLISQLASFARTSLEYGAIARNGMEELGRSRACVF